MTRSTCRHVTDDGATACSYAAALFEDAEPAVVPTLVEHSAAELNDLLATMSFWPRLSSSTVACLVTEPRV